MQIKNIDAPIAWRFCMIHPYGTSRVMWMTDEKARLMLAV